MRQKDFEGGATVVNRREQLRKIFEGKFSGHAPTIEIAKEGIREGLYDSLRDHALLSLAKREVRSMLKEKDAAGRPYAAGVEKNKRGQPINVQYRFWKEKHFAVYANVLRNQVGAIESELVVLRTDHKSKFGIAPPW